MTLEIKSRDLNIYFALFYKSHVPLLALSVVLAMALFLIALEIVF